MDAAPKDELFSEEYGEEEFQALARRWKATQAMDEESREEERNEVTRAIFKLGLGVNKK